MSKRGKQAKITPEVIEHTAMLARIKLTSEQKKMLSRELPKIFDYISSLSEINTSGAAETAHPAGAVNTFMEDLAAGNSCRKGLFDSAKDVKNNLFISPSP